jgi:Tol biopolymer transport system component
MNRCKNFTVIVIMLFSAACSSTKTMKDKSSTLEIASDAELLYFGEEKPTINPLVFAPGIISKGDRYEFGCTFSKDGKEMLFGVDNEGVSEIYQTILENGEWSPQEKLFPESPFSHNDPMLSQDGEKLFFISDRPLKPAGDRKDIDIWYSNRTIDSWSDPINLGTTINGSLDEYFVSFTDQGTIYFASKDTAGNIPNYAFDIYRAEYKNGKYERPEKLPEQINTNRYEADVYVAPDESYLIFCSIRKEGLGNGDLYISFKTDDGRWTKAISMGEKINSAGHELCPFVSRDGKYFFYTSKKDIYWVSTEILETYRAQSGI